MGPGPAVQPANPLPPPTHGAGPVLPLRFREVHAVVVGLGLQFLPLSVLSGPVRGRDRRLTQAPALPESLSGAVITQRTSAIPRGRPGHVPPKAERPLPTSESDGLPASGRASHTPRSSHCEYACPSFGLSLLESSSSCRAEICLLVTLPVGPRPLPGATQRASTQQP